MALDFKALQKIKGNPSTEVAPNRRLKINPGQDYRYDMPRELIDKVNKEFPLGNLFSQESEVSDEELARQGEKFMKVLIQEADSEACRDRTAAMIEQVAKQTGVHFPHVFERYIELGILSLRPRDAWTVTQATTKTLKVRSFNCGLGKQFTERGIKSCEAFCLAASRAAAAKIGLNLDMTCRKDDNGACELVFCPR
ncbi:hypothetical protein REC12_22735 [Desulfosporosinus sp. PR]|uniref:hypothetical protein n=1 Tax=Candidatus Desulfosporosinus nitrosoreducens TaxID=3401928 RepID=UPI0027EA2D18|nr:hypothetical protein [Desulfosporosinus sp. PR]MDQ7096416.1 hypothetical protein [Desulfosporosinus sp. PR]